MRLFHDYETLGDDVHTPPPPLLAPLSTGFAIEKDYSELTALEKGLREIGQESLAGNVSDCKRRTLITALFRQV